MYLSSMRVQDALAQSNPYLIGVPSLTAIWGFVHQYQLNIEKLTDEKEPFVFDSFAIFIRDEHIHRGAKLSEPNQVVAKKTITPTRRPTTRADVFADLVLDIVIKVQCDRKLSGYDKVLKASLPTRFAGGTIFPPKLDVEAKWLQVFTAKSSLFFSLKGLDCSGSWLSPVDEVPFSLDALGALIAEDQSIVVTANGYKLLESPKHRVGSTTGLHAYAENTLGLAKKVNAVEYRISGRDHFFSSAFWSISVNTQSIQIIKNR